MGRTTTRTIFACAILVGIAGLCGSGIGDATARTPAPVRSAWSTITWDTLVPADWDPNKLLLDQNPALIREGSARELELMEKMREVLDSAPTRLELDGKRVRLPGYVVPLDSLDGTLREFLLVPYLGACIHSPPPPANQIVHVRLDVARPLRTMEAVWVSGTLRVRRSDSPMGVSGYALVGEEVEPYREMRRR
jgi:hypothetical protein